MSKIKLVVALKGGLGNQLFQYAFARELSSIDKSIVIVFDTRFYLSKDHKYPRDLLLERFVGTIDSFPGLVERSNDFRFRLFNKAHRLSRKNRVLHLLRRYFYLKKLRFGNVLIEDFEQGYNEIFFRIIHEKVNQNITYLLDGYWCDLRYFFKNIDKLRREIKLDIEKIKQIYFKNNEYVCCLHIRRGDYMTIGQNENGLFIGLDYYQNAIQYLKNIDVSVFERPVWVFSDDMAWCKQNLSGFFPYLNFIWSSEKFKDEESFELMRYFKYKICANSTYSLWAAYLSHSENSISIFPKIWVAQYKNIGFELLPSNNCRFVAI